MLPSCFCFKSYLGSIQHKNCPVLNCQWSWTVAHWEVLTRIRFLILSFKFQKVKVSHKIVWYIPGVLSSTSSGRKWSEAKRRQLVCLGMDEEQPKKKKEKKRPKRGGLQDWALWTQQGSRETELIKIPIVQCTSIWSILNERKKLEKDGYHRSIFLQKYSCPRDLRIGRVGGDMKKSWGVLSGIVKVGHAAMVQLFQSEEILLSISQCTFALLTPAKPQNSNLHKYMKKLVMMTQKMRTDRQKWCSLFNAHVNYVSYQNSAGETFRPIYIAHCKRLREYSKYLQQW